MKNVHLVLLISPINKVGKIIIKIHPGLNERECNVSDLNGATFTTFLISYSNLNHKAGQECILSVFLLLVHMSVSFLLFKLNTF